MKPKDWGFLGVLGFVGAVMGVAYLSERRRVSNSSRTPGAESCPRDEETVQIYLKRLSDAFGTEQPPYTFKAGEVCPPQYTACITYPEPLHFKCGHVQPVVVAHEYGHWLLKKMGSPYYADEPSVECLADLSLKLIKRGEARGLVRISGMASPLCWAGGKSKLVKKLKRLIPAHRIYVEPFFGAGHLYWGKNPSEVEVINDIDQQLMDFYRYLAKTENLSCDMTPSVQRWQELRSQYRGGRKLSPCDYLYLIKYTYGCRSKPSKLTLARRNMKDCQEASIPSDCKIQRVKANLDAYKRRLMSTEILSEDYENVVTRYDSAETFYYLDPPYVSWEEDEEKRCEYVSCAVSPERLSHVLKQLEGKWLLTYDDHPRVRKAFRDFDLQEVSTAYELQRTATRTWKPVKNLIIRNYN